jgi:hypothetical protein
VLAMEATGLEATEGERERGRAGDGERGECALDSCTTASVSTMIDGEVDWFNEKKRFGTTAQGMRGGIWE